MIDEREREDETSNDADAESGPARPSEDDAADLEELLVTMDRLRHSERIATLRRLASHIAHELGTPLNVIEARALMMSSGEFEGDAMLKNARIIAEQAGRMTKIIRDVIDFADRHGTKRDAVDLLELTTKAVALTNVASARRGVSTEVDASSVPVEVQGDPGKLLQVAMNLLLNGVQVTEEGGTVSIATRSVWRKPHEDPGGPEAEFGVIEVRDHGRGIPNELHSQIFKPFFTTKEAGEGAGLGLSVAQGIVRDHGGWIDVESEVGKGSRFTVYLPRGVR
jgi:two-component system, NtrC family, sensor kinase